MCRTDFSAMRRILCSLRPGSVIAVMPRIAPACAELCPAAATFNTASVNAATRSVTPDTPIRHLNDRGDPVFPEAGPVSTLPGGHSFIHRRFPEAGPVSTGLADINRIGGNPTPADTVDVNLPASGNLDPGVGRLVNQSGRLDLRLFKTCPMELVAFALSRLTIKGARLHPVFAPRTGLTFRGDPVPENNSQIDGENGISQANGDDVRTSGAISIVAPCPDAALPVVAGTPPDLTVANRARRKAPLALPLMTPGTPFMVLTELFTTIAVWSGRGVGAPRGLTGRLSVSFNFQLFHGGRSQCPTAIQISMSVRSTGAALFRTGFVAAARD